MKKFLVLTLAVALVGAFTLPNMASAAKMIFKGDYRVVGVASDNVHDFVDSDDGAFEDNTAYVEQRFRLNTIAVSENVKAVLGVEIGWDEWGKSYSTQSGMGTLGGTSFSGGDTGVISDTKSTNMEMKWMYIDFKIPDTGLSVMIGGKAPLYTHDHLILTAAAETPGIQLTYSCGEGGKIKAWWAKMVEGQSPYQSAYGSLQGQNESDEDLFYIEYTQKMEAVTFGGYGAYDRDNREIGTSLASILYSPTAITGVPKGYDVDQYWLGAFASFNAGPVSLNLHGAYSFGTAEAVRGTTEDIDNSGYYLRAKAKMKLDGATLNAGSFYASGDDDLGDDEMKNFGFLEGPTRYPSLSLIFDAPNLFYWGNGVAIEEYTQVCLPPSGTDNLGRWFTNVGVTIPVEKLKLVGELWYLMSAQDPSDEDTYNQDYRDDQIGFEIDLEAHYALTKELTVSAELDYLIAGDYLKASDDDGPDNAWLVAWGVKYAF